MRLLFITNFYPPVSLGGYEQWCQEVAEGLRSRGHAVTVLTSRHEKAEIITPEPAWIHRDLYLEMSFSPLTNAVRFFTHRRQHERQNLLRLDQLIDEVRPDALLVWGMWNLHRSLPALAETKLPRRVVYYLGDYWPTLPSQLEFYWETPGRTLATRLPKHILRVFARRILRAEPQQALAFEHGLFPTSFLRAELARRGITFQHTQIIPGGIDTTLYSYCKGAGTYHSDHKMLSLLYAGRLTYEKGVHTAIKAIDRLVSYHGFQSLHLTIAGSGPDDYTAYLREFVSGHHLSRFVTFVGPQPKEAMPALYSAADALVFTSLWQEPFGRVLIEAMASGTVVIGSATGSVTELLDDGYNVLLFPPGDADALADRILHLAASPTLCQLLIEAGRRTAITAFDIRRMIREIETYLEQVAA